eukprot:CAMPEP_0195078828 /NCGR_PEP_ID=MMETSP0448-20130528/20913_1 /TAXON_ID=66468 /ORGANISM="Heterocapsa triquestra, Strain CCMP 448" /LENGTH=289 /DNA_ID=CAMNT_0040111597 /DNA_START=82 /DNA_END=951 /DNA_ORIENTATION=-
MADAAAAPKPPAPEVNMSEVLAKASKKALTGGLAGMGAQAINVLTLMWMRTIMNYQYRYGGSLGEVVKKLYADGGVPRFYRGLVPGLIQAPVSRFGDTAANDGMLAALEHTTMPTAAKTMCASGTAAVFRVFLMPIDAWKTTKQVEGKEGLQKLIEKTKKHPTALWQGALGAMTATWVGHYPWFYTNNQLREVLPDFDFAYGKYVRNAFIGFCSAAVSDTCSNSLRVLKTTRQTSLEPVGYLESARTIIAKDGYAGLFGRGLGTRIMTNGVQGALFTIGWKAISEMLNK